MTSLRNLILSNSPDFQKAKECFDKQSTFKMVGETFKKPRYADYPEDLSRWLEKKTFASSPTRRTLTFFFLAIWQTYCANNLR